MSNTERTHRSPSQPAEISQGGEMSTLGAVKDRYPFFWVFMPRFDAWRLGRKTSAETPTVVIFSDGLWAIHPHLNDHWQAIGVDMPKHPRAVTIPKTAASLASETQPLPSHPAPKGSQREPEPSSIAKIIRAYPAARAITNACGGYSIVDTATGALLGSADVYQAFAWDDAAANMASGKFPATPDVRHAPSSEINNEKEK